jgi:hypothetical protein
MDSAAKRHERHKNRKWLCVDFRPQRLTLRRAPSAATGRNQAI